MTDNTTPSSQPSSTPTSPAHEVPDLQKAIDEFWQSNALPVFKDFVKIPCISPSYDPDWPKSPYLAEARALAKKWINSLPELNATIYEAPQKKQNPDDPPPVLLVQIPASTDSSGDPTPGNILTYGHFDKQTVAGETWTEPPNVPPDQRGPFIPNVYQDHLYGRGTSDDGFATFVVITAVWAMNQLGMPYPTVNVIIDFDEESGSENLPQALDDFADLIGEPDLCIELDSSIGTYETLWYGATARGTITGTLSVSMLSTQVHSGDGGGIIPNPVNIMRILLDRIQDPRTGEVIVSDWKVPIPADNLATAQAQAAGLGAHLVGDFPWVGNAYPYKQEPVQIVLDKTWRAALALTGQSGLPSLDDASNVIVPEMQYQLSIRLPPSVHVHEAQRTLKKLLEEDPPFGATVCYDYKDAPIGAGWVAPPRASWFDQALQVTSRQVWGQDPVPSGDGGTISVLNQMTQRYASRGKTAQILATGAAGPGNNEHGANENLDMGYARKLSTALALMIQAASLHAAQEDKEAQQDDSTSSGDD